MGKNVSGKTNLISSKTITVVKIIFFVLLAVSVIGLVYLSYIDHANPLEFNEPVYIDSWTVTDPDGNVFESGDFYRNEGLLRGTFTMDSVLPDGISDDSYFCVVVGGDVAVYINDVLRKDFVESRDIPLPGGCVKRFYMLVPLTPGDSGAHIRLVRIGTTRRGYVYQDTFVTTSGGFVMYMMSNYGLSLMLAEILLIFSGVLAILSLSMMILYRRRIDLLYGSMSILVISGWLITNSFVYPFLYGHYHIDGIMNYILCLMMPFSLIFYLDALQHGRYRKVMTAVSCIAAVNLIVWPILHFTETFAFPRALIYIDAFLGIELLTVAGVLVADVIKGGVKEYRYTAIGFAGFFVCGVAEIAILNFMPIMNENIPMLIGLAFILGLAVVQQIDDLRRMREEGQRAMDLSEAKTKFLASMSHEIRTPINAVLGMNEMILRENKDPVIDEYANSVKSSGQMLLMLVNDVLDFSKIEAGKMEISKAEYTFSELLRNIMPMLKERADEKNLKLQLMFSSEVPDGQIGDGFRIRQILINLINNAIKYTDEGAVTLMLGGEYTGDDSYLLKMSVKDTGRGISEEDQKTLFEAFARADVKKNRSIEGTGLGLAIVKSIVDSMEGEIEVFSRYGEGSEFIVHLPVGVYDKTPLNGDYDKNAGSTASSENVSDYKAPNAAILAVDDNNSNLKIVKLFLKRVGIVPDLCDGGLKAVEMCRARRYDLILLDHMMPDPDGIKTLSLIRGDDTSLNKDTPVIVLTANALAGSRKMYLDAGFIDYLTKPIDSSLLEQTIKQYLPADKVLESMGTAAESTFKPTKTATLRERLETIDGLDYETAMGFTGNDEELLQEMVETIAAECDEKIDIMRSCVANEDWKGYMLETHSIKGLMASIGLRSMSERAKKHEFAAKDNDVEFIKSECEDFFAAYREVCSRLD
ncbi:Signal transduction histidine kinase [Lachnospiraceae bacterium XBB2008]|nr:Signal transduction histidine kinase [Lachnospiraceae bacterium XBB2008]